MAYQSRKRHYTSRREKFEKTKRNTRIVLIFATIGLFVWLMKERHEIYSWVKTYFY